MQIAAAEADIVMLLVLRDADEHVVSLHHRLAHIPVPRAARTMLAEQLTAAEAARYPGQTQFVWQVWHDSRWTLLGIVDMPGNSTPTGPR